MAFVYADREALAAAVQRLVAHNWPVDSAEDHGATISVYLHDPDGNGVELYYDQPRADWTDENGRPVVKAEQFDWHDLLLQKVPQSGAKSGGRQ